jgi:hypothetical protein
MGWSRNVTETYWYLLSIAPYWHGRHGGARGTSLESLSVNQSDF